MTIGINIRGLHCYIKLIKSAVNEHYFTLFYTRICLILPVILYGCETLSPTNNILVDLCPHVDILRVGT
jgi:hypothetical protein